MRTIDQPEDMQPLAPPIRRPAEVKPHRKIAEGVWQAPDGKFETQIPTPPTPTIWELYGIAKTC